MTRVEASEIKSFRLDAGAPLTRDMMLTLGARALAAYGVYQRVGWRITALVVEMERPIAATRDTGGDAHGTGA